MNLHSNLPVFMPTLGKASARQNKPETSLTAQNLIPLGAKDIIQFSGGSATDAAKEAAKSEAQKNNKSLIEWSKANFKFVFKTAFDIVRIFIDKESLMWLGAKTKEILHKTGDAMSNIGDQIGSFVQHGWNFSKDHIVTGFQWLSESFGHLIHRGSELLFSGSIVKTENSFAPKSLKFGGQNDSPAQSSQAFNPPTMAGQAIEQKDLTKAQTLEIQLKAQAAQRKFEREAKKPNITESERSSISVRYATEIFNPLFENLIKIQPQLTNTVLKDVHEIMNELNAISFETAKAQKFADLREFTQDRIINLIVRTLKHNEPSIVGFGQELATSLGITPATILRLKTT